MPKIFNKMSEVLVSEEGEEILLGRWRRHIAWLFLLVVILEGVVGIALVRGTLSNSLVVALSTMSGLLLFAGILIFIALITDASGVEKVVLMIMIARYIQVEFRAAGITSKARPLILPPPVLVQMAMDRAADVLGGPQKAALWLGTPVRALNFATPISILSTPDGVERVNDLLGQIEHGVW